MASPSYRKKKYKVNPTTVKVTQAGLFTAVIFVFTMFVKIPVYTGYVHLGDAFIYLYAAMGGGVWALLAGSLGAALADLAGGFGAYAIPTVIIKALVALPFVLAARHQEKILNLWTGLMNIVAAIISTGGYFIANYILFRDMAVASIPFTILQAAGSTVVFLLAAAALDRAGMKQRMLSYTGRPTEKKAEVHS